MTVIIALTAIKRGRPSHHNTGREIQKIVQWRKHEKLPNKQLRQQSNDRSTTTIRDTILATTTTSTNLAMGRRIRYHDAYYHMVWNRPIASYSRANPIRTMQQRYYHHHHTRKGIYDNQIPIVVSSFLITTYFGTDIIERMTTTCDYAMLSPPAVTEYEEEQKSWMTNHNQSDIVQHHQTDHQLSRYWRMFKRMIKLTITLSPIVFFYPFYLLTKNRKKKKQIEQQHALDDDSRNNDNIKTVTNHSILTRFDDLDDDNDAMHNWYYALCLYCVECSGACVIKLMQWASSRPDLFGNDFCGIFDKLQDNTIPHSWQHTEQLLIQYYGPNYHQYIQIPHQQKSLIGSGCIGQVYHGKVLIRPSNSSPSLALIHEKDRNMKRGNNNVKHHRQDNGGIWQDVAIKVLHPTVEDDILADLDLLRSLVSYIDSFPLCYVTEIQKLKWLNLYGIVNELSHLLQLQLDLRIEGNNLQKFRHNFDKNEHVIFPKLISNYPPMKHILIEEYCDNCIPILQYCRENYQNNSKQLSILCTIAIKAVCQMIFLDNFVHGDLHPGNVFVTTDGKKFVLLDAGIVNEYSDVDHQIIVDVLAAFVRKDGKKAGRLMIDDSNAKLSAASIQDQARNEEDYIRKIEELTIRASTKGYLMEQLGSYISFICNAASTHHVMMNPAFISAALAVKVQEGIALAMDPSIQIPNLAIPIIIESERRRLLDSAKASNIQRMQKLQQFIENMIMAFKKSPTSPPPSQKEG